MLLIRRILTISSAIQHLQLAWSILESFGLVKAVGIGAGIAAAVTGAGAFVAQEPWYWIMSLVISVFAGVMVVAASTVVIQNRLSATMLVPDARTSPTQLQDGMPADAAVYASRSIFREHDGVLWADERD